MQLVLYHQLPYIVLLIACVAAAVTDIRARKIPNAIPLMLVVCALTLRATQGPGELLTALATVFVVMAVGLAGFCIKALGGGDVKLLAAACACIPVGEGLYFLLFTAVGGGILAIVTAAFKGTLKQTLSGSFAIFHGLTIDPTTRIATQSTTTLPYAIAITFGALSITLMHTFDPASLRVF